MGTLVNTLCSFKRHYDANTPLAQVMPELVEQYPDTYANIGIHDLGDTMFARLKENNPGARLNEAYSGLPVAEITRVKRTTRLSTTMSNWYPLKICRDVSRQTQLSRIRRIPMLLSGENFGDKTVRK